MKTFELYLTGAYSNELEGVFDSLSEIAKYLDTKKAYITLMNNGEYDSLPAELHPYYIVEVFDAKTFAENQRIHADEAIVH